MSGPSAEGLPMAEQAAPSDAGEAVLSEEALERMVNRLQARLSWRQAEACVHDIEPEIRALVAAARAEGAAAERERNTYRDKDGNVLRCPRCGMSEPEGYTEEELYS